MPASPSFDSSSSSSILLPPSLEQARIRTLPSTAYYIPNFISEEEERVMLDKIRSAPQPRWRQLTHRRLQTWPSDLVQNKLLDAPLPAWLETPVVPRMLSLLRSDDDDDGINDSNDQSGQQKQQQQHSGHIFANSPHQRPNHVLINEYPPGIGIMPHKLSAIDGPVYWPAVCTVSLGASLCLNLHRSRDDGVLDPTPAWRILQEPRSLLITTDSLYTDFLHGIADVEEDVGLDAGSVANWSLLRDVGSFAGGRNVRGTRMSLTYRDVIQVSRVGSKLGLFQRR